MIGIQEFKVKVLKNGIHYVTSDYKSRNSARKTHSGIDLVSHNGKYAVTDYIVAPYDGTVTSVRKETAGGNIVEITHPSGIVTLYAHLKNNSITVKVRDHVTKGQVFARMGNTGTDSTGAHLHLSVLVNGKITDPLPYLNDESLYKDKPVNKDKWVKGAYKLLKSKYIRTTPEVANNYVLVKSCMASVKPKLTSTKGTDKARFKIGVTVDINEFTKDKKGNIWGKMKSTWICVWDSTGDQVKIL